jgi:hypothetical protein
MRIKTILIVLLLVSGILFSSCRSRRGTKAQRQAYDSEEQLKTDNDEMVAEYKEHHYDLQADQTKEMIKQSKKRNKQLQRSKKESWFDRVFRPKRSKNCNGN